MPRLPLAPASVQEMADFVGLAFELAFKYRNPAIILDELLDILSLRPEYFGEEGEPGPFVYHNGDYIGTLKRAT